MLKTALLMVALPALCALLLLPFFYRNSTTPAPATVEFVESQIYSLPEYEKVADVESSIYEWLRLTDPRQYLLPDTRAGFSKFLKFEPRYGATAFPIYQSTKPARQPQYDELFSRIVPQFPRSVVNEQIHRFWQPLPLAVKQSDEVLLQIKPSAQRPVWRLAGGMTIGPAEEPTLESDVLDYWKNSDNRRRLAEIFLSSGGRTILELQILPAVALPQVTNQGTATKNEPRIAVNRVVLRRSCGDATLDHAAVSALRRLMNQRADAMTSATPGNYPIQVDWNCW